MGATKDLMMEQEDDSWSDVFTRSDNQLSFEEPITDEQCITITELLNVAKIDYESKGEMLLAIENKSITSEQAFKCINHLNNNIGCDEIAAGTNYNATDILKKLKREI
jgi:hypothetical protein